MLLLSMTRIVIKSNEKIIQTVQSGLSSVQTNYVCNNNNNKHSNKALKVIVMALIDSHTAKQQSNTPTIKTAIGISNRVFIIFCQYYRSVAFVCYKLNSFFFLF